MPTIFQHYSSLISNLPPGLDRAILRILTYHIGRSAAVSRMDLLDALGSFQVDERALREQIKQLRRQGHLIGSASGLTGGYYLISSAQEFRAFLQSEYTSMIADMSETAAAMRRSAAKTFPDLDENQPSLLPGS